LQHSNITFTAVLTKAPSLHTSYSLQTGDIHASISEEDGGMVRFLETTDEAAGTLAGKVGLASRYV